MLRFILYLNGDRSVSRALLPIPFFVMCDSVAFLVSKSRAQGCDSFDPLPTLATSNIIMGCPTEPCCNHMAFHTEGRTTLPWNPFTMRCILTGLRNNPDFFFSRVAATSPRSKVPGNRDVWGPAAQTKQKSLKVCFFKAVGH